jgi:putative ABC transport system ATP-binding protein
LIGGIDRPTSGTVRVGSRSVGELSEAELTLFRRRDSGIVFQFFNLLSHITVLENVELPRALDGASDGTARPQAARPRRAASSGGGVSL